MIKSQHQRAFERILFLILSHEMEYSKKTQPGTIQTISRCKAKTFEEMVSEAKQISNLQQKKLKGKSEVPKKNLVGGIRYL